MDCVGLLAISSLVLVILFGTATAQVILYHTRFRKRDPLIIRIVVLVAWSCALAQLVCLCHAVYTYTIVNFYASFVSIKIPATLAAAALLGGVVHPLVQATLTFRMWKFHHLTQSRWHLVTPLLCWTIAAYVLGATIFLSTMALFTIHDTSSLLQFFGAWRWWISSVLILTAVVDALVSSTLVVEFFLHRLGSMQRTVQLLDKLILWTIPTGALTCITAVAINVFFLLSMDSFIWLAMFFVLTDLYANTLLALLNSRWRIDDLDDDSATLPTFRVSGSRSHSQRSAIGGPPTRRQLRGMPSNDTFNIVLARPGSANDYYNNLYSTSGISSHPLTDGFTFPLHPPDSLATFDETPASGSFEMSPLGSPQSVRLNSPRLNDWRL